MPQFGVSLMSSIMLLITIWSITYVINYAPSHNLEHHLRSSIMLLALSIVLLVWSIMLLELSNMLLDNIYSIGITNDLHHMTMVKCL